MYSSGSSQHSGLVDKKLEGIFYLNHSPKSDSLLAHIILFHPSRPPLLNGSCRNFDSLLEKEANELGCTLLIPKAAALYAVEKFIELAAAGKYYGVSQDLLSYRIRITDANRWASNRAKKK